MSYKVMPPGSYLFWRIGLMSPLVRWALTIGMCIALFLSWYLLSTRFFFATTSNKLWCSQCAAQLAELVTSDDTLQQAQTSLETPTTQPSLELLQLCEKQGLPVQTCTCQKPTTKNNLSLQRTTLITSGTLTQLHTFLTALNTSALAIAHLEAHLVQQHQKLYAATFTFDFIVPCA